MGNVCGTPNKNGKNRVAPENKGISSKHEPVRTPINPETLKQLRKQKSTVKRENKAKM